MFKLSTVALLFLACPLLPAAETCQSVAVNDSRIDVTAGSHKISVLGWVPPSPQQATAFIRGFNQSVAYAAKNECGGAQGTLTAVLQASNGNLQQSRDLLANLEATHKEISFKGLGVAMSPEERLQLQNIRLDLPFDISLVKNKCKSTKESIEKYLLLRLGAEEIFAQNHGNKIAIEGLESQELRMRQAQIEAVSFPKIERSQLSPTSSEILAKVQGEINGGLLPTPGDFNRVAEAETSAQLKAVLTPVMALYEAYYEAIRQRNAVIAQNLILKNENYAMVVGRAQMKDLAAQIKNLCSERSTTTKITEQD